MTEQLKPCPFCGNTDLKSGGDDKIVGVWCENCQMTGPNHYGVFDWNTRPSATPGNTDPMLIARYDDELRKVQGGWRGVPISTNERLPEKPGKRSYEHVRCLIFIKGEWEVGMWNCEHLVWDDDEGDDFRYHPTEPTHWMPLPSAPTEHPTEQPSVEEAARVLLANTPNPIFDDLKGVMMGELYWTREISDENGDEATEKLYVPWTTIKEIILAALRSLAQEGE